MSLSLEQVYLVSVRHFVCKISCQTIPPRSWKLAVIWEEPGISFVILGFDQTQTFSPLAFHGIHGKNKSHSGRRVHSKLHARIRFNAWNRSPHSPRTYLVGGIVVICRATLEFNYKFQQWTQAKSLFGTISGVWDWILRPSRDVEDVIIFPESKTSKVRSFTRNSGPTAWIIQIVESSSSGVAQLQ